MKKLTLNDLEKLDREFLIPSEVAAVLGCDTYSINLQVKKDVETGSKSFPFPVMMIGNRVKIPRRAFIEVMKHGAVY